MYGIVSKRSAANVLSVVAVAVAVAGCDWNAASTGIRQQKNGRSDGEQMASFEENILPAWYRSERPVLRFRLDAVGGRLWVLTSVGVDLYDITTRRKVVQIALPSWLWVVEQYSCPPDIAIGPSGEAVVSSNVVPTLWRIDPVTLFASEHQLMLDDDTGKDIGFTGLAYSAQQGAFFAVSALHGSLWRIDPLFKTARNIPLSEPLPKACSLAIPPRAPDQRAGRFVGLCVGTDEGDRVVNLATDQRSGYVRPGQCRG
jgi:hypothetical protein